jgi:hypothetical protein
MIICPWIAHGENSCGDKPRCATEAGARAINATRPAEMKIGAGNPRTHKSDWPSAAPAAVAARFYRLRVAMLDVLFLQRLMTDRIGPMAMMWTTITIRNNPNIARTRVKFGLSSATKTAGTIPSADHIASEIQWSVEPMTLHGIGSGYRTP